MECTDHYKLIFNSVETLLYTFSSVSALCLASQFVGLCPFSVLTKQELQLLFAVYKVFGNHIFVSFSQLVNDKLAVVTVATTTTIMTFT